MKYVNTIIFLLFLNFFTALSLLYFSNMTRNVERHNVALLEDIKLFNQQININEIEYNLYHRYAYLKKMHKIYFDKSNINLLHNRISYQNLKQSNFKDLITIGIK